MKDNNSNRLKQIKYIKIHKFIMLQKTKTIKQLRLISNWSSLEKTGEPTHKFDTNKQREIIEHFP